MNHPEQPDRDFWADIAAIGMGISIGLLIAMICGPPSIPAMILAVLLSIGLLTYVSLKLHRISPEEEGSDWKDRD